MRTLNAEMQAQLESNDIEFYELVTPDKLVERGNSKNSGECHLSGVITRTGGHMKELKSEITMRYTLSTNP